MKIPELLAPAGNMERFYTALRFGADAVYVGMEQMSLRNFADNFTLDQLFEACGFAHKHRKRVYVAVNAFARDHELANLPSFLRDIQAAGADALIVNDPGVIRLSKEHVPEMELHLSTQANTLNAHAAKFWQEQGVKRIVLARELSLDEARGIKEQVPGLALEVFVHGAMCVSYSGRCLLSNYISGRDSNKGECAQPCRWTYELRERGKNGEHFPIEQDAQGTYVLNSRDLNLMPKLHAVLLTGADSLKIEGRMKSVYYVATVVNAYRMALDAYRDRPLSIPPDAALMEELHKASHRPYTTGFAFGDPGAGGQMTRSAGYVQTHELSAVVLEYDEARHSALVEQRNRFFLGDTLEILSPGSIDRTITVSSMRTEDGEEAASAPHPQQRLWIAAAEPLQAGDMLRKKLPQQGE
ncbi:MAG TPA: U32 family peptidase [Feifaniaceae bacterium]|nr:U32 family peptidase [Feifaniaceae bacterium]